MFYFPNGRYIDCLSFTYATNKGKILKILLLLLPLVLQPAVGFGLSNNTSPFFPIYHQLYPSSHSQHLKISFHLFSPSFPGSSSSCRSFQFLSEDLFGRPILPHSLQVTQPTYPLPLYPFYYIFSFTWGWPPIFIKCYMWICTSSPTKSSCQFPLITGTFI